MIPDKERPQFLWQSKEDGSYSQQALDSDHQEAQVPVAFPTDVGADLTRQPVKLILQVPATGRRVVVPAKFLVRCIWPDVGASEAVRCQHCRLRENAGADLVVDVAVPLEELVQAVGNERAFLEVQARRSVRCHRDCSQVEVVESRNMFFQTGFEPLDPNRQRADSFNVEIISGTGLPLGERLQVSGRVVEVGAKGLRLVHDGPIEPAPVPPGETSRLRARAEMQPFLGLSEPLQALARAVQRDVTANTLASMTDMACAVLLTVFSPVGLPLRGGRENFTRRAQLLMLGDFGARKSTTVTDIMQVIGFGTLVGPRTSVAGLVGTIEDNNVPRPRWGAMVREDRGLLVIEEGGTINPQVIAAIRDARERGWISLHLRGVSYSAPCAPAIIVNANPSMNRTLASFGIWAEALTALSNHQLPDLRRFTLVLPISLDALTAAPIDTDGLPAISAGTLRTIAWVARTIGPDRIDLDAEAVTRAHAAEIDLRATLPRHASIQAVANHSANKLLYLSTAWAIASQLPLEGEVVRVTAADVETVLPLYRRTLLAWTTRGVAEAFDPEKVRELIATLREATRSRGRKHRLDPLDGLRVLQSAPFGLTVVEWSSHVGASDKTIRDAWLRPLLERHGLVERAATRYRITPLGRAVIAAAENEPPDPDGTKQNGSPQHHEGTEILELAEVVESDAGDKRGDIHLQEIGEQMAVRDPAGVTSDSERSGEILELPEVPGTQPMTKETPIIPPGITVEDFLPKPEDGTLRPMKVIWDDREKDSALAGTGGFLHGYTHTLNPAVGCVFACSWCGLYCYAQWETPARLIAEQLGLRWGEYLFVKKRIAEVLERDLARAVRRDAADPHHVSQLKVFMSSVTEPCAGPALAVTRECLQVFARYPIGRLVLQTRSPRVVELLPELKALGSRVLVSFTVESDTDAIWQEVEPPMLPRLRDRRKAVALLHQSGVVTSVTVSPCARLADPEEFAVWIAMNASYAVVDTFIAGDGRGGSRTEKTETPSLFAAHGWMWSEETAARMLYEQIRSLIGDRVGWSKDGFNRLTDVPAAHRRM